MELTAVVDANPAARRRARWHLPGVRVLGSHARLPATYGALVAVPDRAVPGCARALAGQIDPRTRVVLHASGALPAAVLEPLRARGRTLASLHPLMTFARGDGPRVSLTGVAAAVEGDPAGVRVARRLARQLGLVPFALAAEDRARYHALAALAANFTSVLIAAACGELSRLGPSRRWSRRALEPLVLQAVRNVLATGDLSRLTGPLVRGDVDTVAAHARALPSALSRVYDSIARLAVEMLHEEGRLGLEAAQGLTTALTNPCLYDSVAVVRLREEG